MAGYDDYRPTSRFTSTKDGVTIERTIHIWAADEIAAAADGDAPALGDGLSGLYCNNVSVNQVAGGVNAAGFFLFEVTATYQGLDKSPVKDKARWSVSSQNEQVKRYAVDAPALQDHYYDLDLGGYSGQGIGVTEDGAEGVEVDDPNEVLRIDLWMAPADTGAYLDILRGLRNHTNNAAFEGPWGSYAEDEARLVGFNVQHVNGELDEISVEFLCRKNTSFNVTVKGDDSSTGGTVVEVVKPGHAYYWQRMQKQQEEGDDTKASVNILDAHVAEVYPDGDFSTLGVTYAMFDMEEPGS